MLSLLMDMEGFKDGNLEPLVELELKESIEDLLVLDNEFWLLAGLAELNPLDNFKLPEDELPLLDELDFELLPGIS